MGTWEHKHAPRDWPELAVAKRAEGAVKLARKRATRARESGYPMNLCICGPSGVGKSTLAGLLARLVLGADDTAVLRVSATRASAELAELDDEWGMSTMFGSGWRVIIIEEAHQLSGAAVTRLLTMAEAGIAKRATLLTTTDSRDQLPGGSTGPFCSRFQPVHITSQGMAEAGARRLRQIARAEGVDGKPEGYYVAIMKSKGVANNMRLAVAALEDLEA